MAKFIFKMQGLLNIREKLEEQSKTEYGKALNKLEEEKHILVSIENEKSQSIQNLKKSINESVKPNYIKTVNQYMVLLEKRKEEQMQNIEKAKQLAEEKRQALLKAMKDRKILEALKEKEKEAYFKEELQREQKIIDEIVSYKYNEA